MENKEKYRIIILFIVLVAIGGLVLFDKDKGVNKKLIEYGIVR